VFPRVFSAWNIVSYVLLTPVFMRILCNTEVQNDKRYIRLRTNTALQNAWYWYEWVQCLVKQASLAAYSTMR